MINFKNHIVTFLFLVALSITVSAQHSFNYSQYIFNPYIFNPAAGGTSSDLSMKLGFRKQWTQFTGAPISYYITAHAPLIRDGKPGGNEKKRLINSIGGVLHKHTSGPLSRTSALASYSYTVPLSEKLQWVTGAFAGVINYSLDISALEFDQNGEVFAQNQITKPEVSFGTWLHDDYFFVGLSVNQLLQNNISFIADNPSRQVSSNQASNYYLIHGYNFPLDEKNSIVPSILIKYAGRNTKLTADVNAKYIRKNRFWIGGTYQHREAIALLAGVTLNPQDANSFELGYSYDYPINSVNQFSSGSHEIVLSYKFKHKFEVVCPDNFW